MRGGTQQFAVGGRRSKTGRAGGGRRGLNVVFGVRGCVRGLEVGGVGFQLRPH